MHNLTQRIADAQQIEATQATQALVYLQFYGYLVPALHSLPAHDGISADSAVKNAVAAAQVMMGQTPTGIIDKEFVMGIFKPRCACSDYDHFEGLGSLGLEARWNKRTLTWTVKNYLPSSIMPETLQEEILQKAYKQWSEITDRQYIRVETQPADVTIFCKPIDGPGRILAQAQLPPGNDQPLWLQIDSSEPSWANLPSDPAPYLLGTVCHEMGHNEGLGHSQYQTALMKPFADNNIWKPQQIDDIPRIQALYGKPKALPTPPPITPSGMNTKIILEFDGPLPNFKVFRQ